MYLVKVSHACRVSTVTSPCLQHFYFPFQDEIEKVQFQALSQSVKAICNILSKIETIDIAKSLQRVESILKQLKGSVAPRSQISATPEHADGGYATLQRHR